MEHQEVEVNSLEESDLGLDEFLSAGKAEGEETKQEGEEIKPSPDEEGREKAPSPGEKEEGKEKATGEDKGKEGEKGKEADEKKAGEEKIESPGADYESDDNPYKKRYTDTAAWGNALNKEVLGLRQRISLMEREALKSIKNLHKKFDGTYTGEEEEEQRESPSKEMIEGQAEYNGRLNASRQMAERMYGQDFVNKMLYAPDAPFKKYERSPMVQVRLLTSEAPVMEALQILKEEEFFEQYGRDADTIKKNLIESLKPSIQKELQKEFEEKLKLAREHPATLKKAKGEASEQEAKNFKPAELDSLFDN